MRANGVYLIVIINKTPLRNGNCPITDPITEMGVAHTMAGAGRNQGPLQQIDEPDLLLAPAAMTADFG